METPAGQKTLMLLRHAKSDWDSGAVDHARPLNERGRRDAVAVGQLLRGRGLVPELVACSSATRARQTWELAVTAGAQTGEVRYLKQFYLASVSELVATVCDLPGAAATVLLVGHSPGIPDLVQFLAARRSGSPAWARLDQKYPTAGLAILTLTGTWTEAGEARAELVGFEVPRGSATK